MYTVSDWAVGLSVERLSFKQWALFQSVGPRSVSCALQVVGL